MCVMLCCLVRHGMPAPADELHVPWLLSKCDQHVTSCDITQTRTTSDNQTQHQIPQIPAPLMCSLTSSDFKSLDDTQPEQCCVCLTEVHVHQKQGACKTGGCPP
jgi:hypothetical protein